MNKILIQNARIVNRGKIFEGNLLIEDDLITKISRQDIAIKSNYRVVDAKWNYLIPGIIDDQVHFREPGLAHKGSIYTESAAAVVGGITSFIEQPNTVPNATTQEILEEKYQIAAKSSFANYSFMIGATNDNLEEILKTNPKNVAGVKIFMGSSTGNMLVDNESVLEKIFLNTPMLIATHCEDEATIRNNLKIYTEKYGENIPIDAHHLIRSAEACYLSSSKAVALAKKTGARLHVFHISTEKETHLFDNNIPLKDKKITAEVCVHHLWFCSDDYQKKGNFIKWNPAIKTALDRDGLWEALIDDRIDVIATDHAPHTIEEKNQIYTKAPSGGPLVQHSVSALFEKFHQGKISIEKIVEKMAHNPAIIFGIEKRGFIEEGYFADLTIINPKHPWTVGKGNILYKCDWSPFEETTFNSKVTHTFVNGNLVYETGEIHKIHAGKRLLFNR